MSWIDKVLISIRVLIANMLDIVAEKYFEKVYAGKMETKILVDRIYNFCEAYSGKVMYTYQKQFSKRIIKSVLDHDGAELTALFARQGGKTETVSITVGGLMIILPQLANMPMFANDKRLDMYKDGLWVGIFAPSQRQAQITYGRLKSRIQCKESQAVLDDPDFRLTFTTSNGQTVALSNGSFVTAISASDSSNIEGESFKFIICEEAQDISNYKVQKCLTGDTKVLTKDGTYTRIDNIVENKSSTVVCYDKDMNYLTSKEPYEYYDNGVQDVYEITLDNGTSIKATYNHKFYTYSQKTSGKKCDFRTVEAIKESIGKDRPVRIGVADRLPYFARTEDSFKEYNEGVIIGYFLGDGCVKGTPKFIGDIPTCNRLHEIIKETVDSNINMTEYSYNPDNGMSEVCFSTPTNKKNSNTLKTFFEKYDIYNKTGENKKLPDKVFTKDFYLGLISSLIETDGSVECSTTKPVISFANISKELVLQLKEALVKFGIHSTLFPRENKGIGEYTDTKTLWILNIKSVRDIRRFHENIELFRKQCFLEDAVYTVRNKEDREQSKYYSEEMRFCRVKSIEYVGKEKTYCLGVEGRNFIANGIISSNSIHPMGAAYNATVCKIGTSTTFKGDFYDAIQRNKQDYEDKRIPIRSHFEYDYRVVQKYNPNYKKYVEREKRSLGENSDAFRMSYKLEWILSRSMFCDINKVEETCGKEDLNLIDRDMRANHCAGLDVGGGSGKEKNADSSVLTIVEVDWLSPVLMESSKDEETGEEIVYLAYNTYIKSWLEITSEIAEDYEVQFVVIMEFLKNFRISRMLIDSTREASLAQRIKANVNFEVVPYVFSTKSKSDIYKHLHHEINTGRAQFPMSPEVQDTKEYKHFIQQLSDLQKGYSGSHMKVSHPSGAEYHDDYCDSWALAVYATKDVGEVDNTETVDGKTFASSKYISIHQQFKGNKKNNITGRRRR